jgi:hypothetical protein
MVAYELGLLWPAKYSNSPSSPWWLPPSLFQSLIDFTNCDGSFKAVGILDAYLESCYPNKTDRVNFIGV